MRAGVDERRAAERNFRRETKILDSRFVCKIYGVPDDLFTAKYNELYYYA